MGSILNIEDGIPQWLLVYNFLEGAHYNCMGLPPVGPIHNCVSYSYCTYAWGAKELYLLHQGRIEAALVGRWSLGYTYPVSPTNISMAPPLVAAVSVFFSAHGTI